MIRVSLKGLWGRKLRTFLTALAIVIGKVAFRNNNSNTEQTPAFPDSVLAKVKALPDVAAAAGTIGDQVKLIGRDGKVISTKGGEAIAASVDPRNDAQFNPLKLVSGAWPVGNGQIAIDQRTSEKKHFAVGDTISVAADQGIRQFEITGVATFASASSIGASTIAIFDVPTAQALFDKDGKFDEVQVAARPGVTPEKLAGEIRPLLPETAKVKTAEAQTQEQVDNVNEGVGIFQKVLLAFGGIALFVGAFVIANTLSITIAQRMREFATLRTIGGSRRQVLRIVMLEALVVGAVASLFGLLFGLGIVLLVYGIFGGGMTIAARLMALGLGTLILFVGVALNAKRAVRPLAAVLGWPGARIGGSAGTLARENAMRNPSRTASTASALMIGLALITFVAILGAGLRTSFGDAVDKLFVADYALTAENDFDPFTAQADHAVGGTPGVTAVSPIRAGDARVFGDNIQVTAVDTNLAKTVRIDWLHGTTSVPAQLGKDGAFVDKDYAKDHDLKVGSPVAVKTPTGQVLTLRLKGIFDPPKGGSPFGSVTMSAATFDANYAKPQNLMTLVNIKGGAN